MTYEALLPGNPAQKQYLCTGFLRNKASSVPLSVVNLHLSIVPHKFSTYTSMVVSGIL